MNGFTRKIPTLLTKKEKKHRLDIIKLLLGILSPFLFLDKNHKKTSQAV